LRCFPALLARLPERIAGGLALSRIGGATTHLVQPLLRLRPFLGVSALQRLLQAVGGFFPGVGPGRFIGLCTATRLLAAAWLFATTCLFAAVRLLPATFLCTAARLFTATTLLGAVLVASVAGLVFLPFRRPGVRFARVLSGQVSLVLGARQRFVPLPGRSLR